MLGGGIKKCPHMLASVIICEPTLVVCALVLTVHASRSTGEMSLCLYLEEECGRLN